MKTRIGLILLPTALAICSIAATQTDTESSLPSQITTRDGKTYTGVEKVRVDPDGIVVDYQPVPGGLGMAKLKFQNLPDDLKKKYHYDEKQATDFESQEVQITGRFLQARAADENWLIRYRNLAELNRSLAGDEAASYSVALETNGLVAAHGVTQTLPAITNIGVENSYPNYPITFPTIYNGVPVQETVSPVQQP